MTLEKGRTDERPCRSCGLPDATCAELIYGADGYGCCGKCAHRSTPENADEEEGA